jgi:hypothetical protein
MFKDLAREKFKKLALHKAVQGLQGFFYLMHTRQEMQLINFVSEVE